MKLLSYNIWIKINNSKKVGEFIKKHDFDIVLLQENLRNLEDKVFDKYKTDSVIKSIIANKYPYSFFAPLLCMSKIKSNDEVRLDFNGYVEQWNQILSKYPISSATNEFFYWNYELKFDWSDFEKNDHFRSILVSEVKIWDKKIQIINIHWTYSKDKLDSERWFLQCEKILEITRRNNLPTIIAGDFNLFPSTKAINVLSKKFKNLIWEYNITSTRPDFKDYLDEGNNVVDYIFVDEKIKVNSFQVLNTDISDHLPLILDFDII